MRPRRIARLAVIGLVAVLAVLVYAEESRANFAGGSRLLFYYTQRSIVNPAAAAGTATTILGITNQSLTTSVSIRYAVFNGSSCASFGPVTQSVGPRRTLRVNVGAVVAAASFSEGWVDVWAVNGSGQPLRWDQLSGKGTILDFGGVNTSVATYEAAALFSDADRVNGVGSQQGQVIADITDPKTNGMIQGTLDFWGIGGPFGTGHRLVLIPVATTPGATPAASNTNIAWHKTDSTQTRNASVPMPCMLASSLSDLHPAFAANYPNDGTIESGGNLDVSVLSNKGMVGALFETGTTPNALLVVHSLQQYVSGSQEGHE